MNSGEAIQLGHLVSLYEGMHAKGLSQKERLQEAKDLCEKPETLAKMFEEDVEAFASYDNEGVPFHSADKNRDKTSFSPKSKTRVVAQSLITLMDGETVEVAGRPDLNFRYVDREIVSARTPKATFRTTDDKVRSADTLPKLDLLLANAGDGTPIVGELKVGDDRDPFYALIQALAHAAMLVTDNQTNRLRAQYPDTFSQDFEKVDVYVVLVGSAKGSNWPDFDNYARDLAGKLMQIDSFARRVRRVEQVRLTMGARSPS